MEFAERHPDSRDALLAWYRGVSKAQWAHLADVRQTYPHADLVGNKIVFNIKGNDYRLITAIHFNTGKVLIREILTLAEYDKGAWKDR